MKSRRLIKKYKNKSRSRKNRRRVLKGGVPHRSRASTDNRPSSGRLSSVIPSSGVVTSRTSGSVRPSSVGVFKPKFNFKNFYNELMRTDEIRLPSMIEDNKHMYIQATTFQNFEPKGAYPNLTGLQMMSYFYGKIKYAGYHTKNKIKTIISLFDQYGMSHGIRHSDLHIIEEKTDGRYFELYKNLYKEIYDKLFPHGNNRGYPVSLSTISLYVKPHLSTVHEEDDE